MLFLSFAPLSLISLLALPAALAAGTPSPVPVAPTRVRRDLPDASADFNSLFNPSTIVPRSLALNPADPSTPVLTNAQRLSRGLPPRSPARNAHSRRARALHARQSATPCALPQATGRIRVADSSGAFSAYVSRSDANGFGEYSATQDASQALSVVLLRCNSNSDPFEIQAVNGFAAYPYLGLVAGFANSDDNLRAGSTNYAYIAGSSSVALGPAQPVPNAFSASSGIPADTESTVWTLSDASALVPTWVNTDGTPAAGATLVYIPNASAFVLVGDVDAFRAQFGNVTPVTLTFEPSV